MFEKFGGSDEVCRRAGIKREFPSSRVNQRVLRFFGHVERMDEDHMTRSVWVWGRLWLGGVDGDSGLLQQRDDGGF